MSLLSEALKEYGVEEIIGGAGSHNDTILKYFKDSGHEWVHDDETAWCSAFINAMAKRAGLPMSGKLNARSWLEVGEEISVPKSGDLVIFWRGSITSWKGHVAIFINFDEDGEKVNVLGGNQSNMVCIMGYDMGRILSYRRLEKDAQTAKG